MNPHGKPQGAGSRAARKRERKPDLATEFLRLPDLEQTRLFESLAQSFRRQTERIAELERQVLQREAAITALRRDLCRSEEARRQAEERADNLEDELFEKRRLQGRRSDESIH